jgi:hypothetical protein
MTAIAFKSAIATRPKLVSKDQKSALFKDKLHKNYANCQGQAVSEKYQYYQFKFDKKNIYFQINLPPNTESTPSEITETRVISKQPYI